MLVGVADQATAAPRQLPSEDVLPSPPERIEFTVGHQPVSAGEDVIVSYKVLDGSGRPVATVDRWVSGPSEVAEVRWSGPRALSVRALAPGTLDLWIEAVGERGSVEAGMELEIVPGSSRPDGTESDLAAPTLLLTALIVLAFISGYVIESRLDSSAASRRHSRRSGRAGVSRIAAPVPGPRSAPTRPVAKVASGSAERIECPSCGAMYGRGEIPECELCGTTLDLGPGDPCDAISGRTAGGCDHL